MAGVLGPGFIAGGADDDPTAIGTYAQAGAQTGYGLLWTTLLTLPMMSAVQYSSAKVAIVHREGLAQVLRRYFPAPVVYMSVLGDCGASAEVGMPRRNRATSR